MVSVAGAAPTLKNCILWGNTSVTPSQFDQEPGLAVVTVQYCDVDGGFSGTGNIDVDPRFVRNPSPGGDGAWGTTDDDYGDLRITSCSPVADSGNNSAVPAGLSVDLAGHTRFRDIPTTADNGSGAAPIVDMGAYEAVPELSASAGGPYKVGTSQQLQVVGLAGSDSAGPLSYAWEWTGNGQFDDASTATTTIPAGTLPVGTSTIYLRVTDSASNTLAVSTQVTVYGTTLYVDSRATGANDGSSWANAFTSLADALAVGQPLSVIKVAKGTYLPTRMGIRDVSFALRSGVSILGGYAGLGAANPDARDPSLNVTILSGDLNGDGQGPDNSLNVVRAVNADGTALLDGLTITGGLAEGPFPGGALYISGGAPVISNCIFTGNQSNSGGAVYMSNASPSFMNCVFTNNTTLSNYSGGGMYCLFSTPSIQNCTFTANTAQGGGGGIYLAVSDASINNTTFTGNIGKGGGGGIYNHASVPVITNCTFLRNVAASGAIGQIGGGIYNDSGSSVLTNCSFLGNSASTGAGMANFNASWPKLTNCIFVGNKASSSGGGINSSGDATMNVTNCTFVANTATGTGGAISCSNYSSIINSIFWNNVGTGGSQVVHSGSSFVLTYCDGSGFSGTGNINSDPKFVRNPAPGSDAVWGTSDDDYGDLRLQPSSPTADAGSNAAVPPGVSTDIAGNPRFFDVPGLRDPGAIVDMGAYETWLNVYVDPTASGVHNGRTWQEAFTTIESAMAQVIPGQQLVLAQGTYIPVAPANRSATFSIPSGVSLRGGYAGLTGPNPDARAPLTYRTVLSGDLGTSGDSSDNAFHVVTYSGTAAIVLDGLYITGGNASGTANDAFGGGIYNSGTSLTVSNCVIVANAASERGGGMFNSASSAPTLLNCVLIANAATGAGGLGGGLYSDVGTTSISNCTFTANFAGSSGGAIYGTATMSKSIVWANTSSGAAQLAGAIPTSYCDIQGNPAGPGNIGANPLFVDANGADDIYGTPDDDLRLQPSSPCIDSGGNSAVPTSLRIDLAGNPRISDVPGVRDPRAIVDMGAFETPGVWGVTDAVFLCNTTRPSIKFSLSSDVATSTLQSGDLSLFNLTTGQSIDCGTLATATYSAAERSITWTFPTILLPDGNYQAVLNSSSITDTNGAPLPTTNLLDFFALGGDANRDRVVDAADLGILSANWQSSNRVFSQGDFNYDKKVDLRDLLILADNWQTRLPPPVSPASLTLAPRRTATRVISLIS